MTLQVVLCPKAWEMRQLGELLGDSECGQESNENSLRWKWGEGSIVTSVSAESSCGRLGGAMTFVE